MYDVITVGSATVDVFARTKFSELIKIIDPKGETDLLAFPSGAKILIDELEFSTGGGGTNTAVAFSRLGHKVAFVGKLGEGTNSEFIHKSLRREKIDLLCSHGRGKAGYSLILDTLEHDRTILTYKGINDEMNYNEIPLKKLKTKWFYFCAMMNESFKTLERLSDFAVKNNIKIAFNPSTYLAEKGSAYLRRIIKRSHLLILNKDEARLLVGDEHAEKLLFKLYDLGPKIVVITDSKKEILATDGNYVFSAHPTKTKAVDSTGAGDAFSSSFVSGLIRNRGIEFSIKLGIANATSVISHYGAKNILLTRDQALRSIKVLKTRVKKKAVKSHQSFSNTP